MATLTWKGKQPIDENDQVLSSHAAQLYTVETFPGSPLESVVLSGQSPANGWYNRLICGDKSFVLPALLPEFARAVDLIYIDPPFMTGRDFTSGTQLAYSDKWKNDLDSNLQWLYKTFVQLHRLLAQDGSLYVHLDWRATHYAKVIIDEVFRYRSDAYRPGLKS